MMRPILLFYALLTPTISACSDRSGDSYQEQQARKTLGQEQVSMCRYSHGHYSAIVDDLSVGFKIDDELKLEKERFSKTECQKFCNSEYPPLRKAHPCSGAEKESSGSSTCYWGSELLGGHGYMCEDGKTTHEF